MARELILKIHCDFCGTEVDEKDAHSGDISLKGKVYGLDLCPKCAGDTLSKLTPKATALTEEKKGKATPTSERVLPCPICGVKCKNEIGLKFHTQRMHKDIAV